MRSVYNIVTNWWMEKGDVDSQGLSPNSRMIDR